jgi:shikimate dehydrogenase
MSARLLFIGVSTAGSSIFDLFPRWADILGIEAEMAGYDIPLGAPPEAFRAGVDAVAQDERTRGALVTTHKVDVYRHAGDLFDELDANARLCREISCISKRQQTVVGHAKDPITAGRALTEFLPAGYWRETGAHALCLGAGGAGTAIAVYLIGLEQPPDRIIVTDTDRARLDALAAVLGELGSRTEVVLERVGSPADGDALVGALPPGSLVVNATGLGKDAPGSPLSDAAEFPLDGVVWELNYRGDLRFLRQARQQAAERRLAVHDGWRYFLHGWSEVVSEVFQLDLTAERFARLAEAAEPQRPDPT